MIKRQYKQMICLVGENPLPIYIGIRQLCSPNATIWLICSERATELQAKAIKSLVDRDNSRKSEGHLCKISKLSDPYKPELIRSSISEIITDGSTALNITGGTKVMSAFAVTAWQGEWDDIFYVEDARRKFHFASGVTEDIGDLDLSLDDLGMLHGIKLKFDSFPLSIPSLDELTSYLHEIKSRDYIVRSKYHFEYSNHDKNEYAIFSRNKEPFEKCYGLVSKEIKAEWGMPETLPASLENYRLLEWKPVFDFFAKCQWFECLIYLLIMEILNEEDSDFSISDIAFRCQCIRTEYYENQIIDSQMFEGDIFLIFKNRLRFISVTTSPYARICKAKMFEAMHRAKQIGGDMATSCVVCLANDRALNSCRVSVAKYPRHMIFGRTDINYWVRGKTESLRRFLTQDFIMNEVAYGR